MYLKIRKDGDEALYLEQRSGWVKWDNATIFESGLFENRNQKKFHFARL